MWSKTWKQVVWKRLNKNSFVTASEIRCASNDVLMVSSRIIGRYMKTLLHEGLLCRKKVKVKTIRGWMAVWAYKKLVDVDLDVLVFPRGTALKMRLVESAQNVVELK